MLWVYELNQNGFYFKKKNQQKVIPNFPLEFASVAFPLIQLVVICDLRFLCSFY